MDKLYVVITQFPKETASTLPKPYEVAAVLKKVLDAEWPEYNSVIVENGETFDEILERK